MHLGILYQPFKWLAIAVMPRWGIRLRVMDMAGRSAEGISGRFKPEDDAVGIRQC